MLKRRISYWSGESATGAEKQMLKQRITFGAEKQMLEQRSSSGAENQLLKWRSRC
jgi:hypothetical protein